jgi:parallel beta-helix repeat protein
LKSHWLILVILILNCQLWIHNSIYTTELPKIAKEAYPAFKKSTNSLPIKKLQYTPHQPTHIQHDRHLAAAANYGSGTVVDPYVIEGWIIKAPHGVQPLIISGTTKYFILRNCWIESAAICEGCLWLTNITEGTAIVTNNKFRWGGYGIVVEESRGVTLVNNTFQYTSFDIILRYADSTVIKNNQFGDSRRRNLNDQNHCFICKDRVSRHIYDWGLVNINYSDKVKMKNNTILQKYDPGLVLNEAYHCEITENLFKTTDNYAIRVMGISTNNSIHHNIFIDNGNTRENSSLAYDAGRSNQWYDEITCEGNYWSNYNGTGIYEIAGPVNNIDPHPATLNGTFWNPCSSQSEKASNLVHYSLFLSFIAIPVLLAVKRYKNVV